MCSVADCERTVLAKSLCGMHYTRMHLHGTTDKGGQQVIPAYERFWPKVDKDSDPNGCWLWTASLDAKGYGTHVDDDGKAKRAHRLSWAWTNYCPMPPSWLVVDHRCHIRHCMNPDHLRLVTSGQNTENRKGARRNSKAGIRGVSWHTASGKWVASVRSKGKLYNLGYFTDKYEAGEAAKQGRLKYHTHNDMDRK